MHEDRRPWIFEPKGMLSVQMLRGIASLLLAVYGAGLRGRLQQMSWPALMQLFLHMVWTLARVPKRARKLKCLDSS